MKMGIAVLFVIAASGPIAGAEQAHGRGFEDSTLATARRIRTGAARARQRRSPGGSADNIDRTVT